MRKGYRKIFKSILQVKWRKVRYKGRQKWQSEPIVVGKWVIHKCDNFMGLQQRKDITFE